MAAQSTLALLGVRTGTLGTSATLAVAFALAEGSVDTAAHTSASRVGWYVDRTTSAEKIGVVVMGTEVMSVGAVGLIVGSKASVGTGASATALLHLAAGSSTAGTAPLKFTSGTNLGTAEAGAMEWDGTNLSITQTSGLTRKTIAYTTSNITGTATNVTGVVAPANGGTGFNASTASNGQIFIGNGSGLSLANVTGGTGITITNGSGSIAVAISNTAVTAASYGSASGVSTFTVNAQGQLTTAATTSIAIAASQVTSGTLAIAQGGTNASTATAAFNNLSPMTSNGDMIYGGASGAAARLAGNTTASKLFLSGTGTGSAAGTPVWSSILVGDVPNLPASIIASGQISAANGGTGQDCSAAANGTLLIGTGTGLAQALLTAGAGITVTNGSGSITLAVNASTITSGILQPGNGGTGVNNAGTFTNASNTTITGGGTIALGGFTATVPATGTVALLATANAFTAANTFGTVVSPIIITGTAATAVAPPTVFSVTTGAHTALTAGSAGTPLILFDMSASEQWTGTTTVANYMAMRIKCPTVTATTGTTAFTGLVGVQIDGPTSGTNTSASGALALLVVGNQQCQGTLSAKSAPQTFNLGQSSTSSGLAQQIAVAGAAQTGQTASTEAPACVFDYGQTVQHATGALTLQRTFIIKPATYSFVAASNLTDTATFAVQGPPAAGTFCTLVNQPSAIWAQAGQIRAGGNFMSDPGSAPGILQNGQFWTDSTQLTLSTRQAGVTQNVSTTLFSATATATIANTTTETSAIGTGIGTKTLPANFFSVGKTLRLRGGGVFSTLVTPGNLTVKVKFGSTVIATATAGSLLSSASNNGFEFEALITCRTTGSTGTVIIAGNLDYATTASTRAFADLTNAGATTTIDTTASQAIDVTITWATASASNTVSTTNAVIEVLN